MKFATKLLLALSVTVLVGVAVLVSFAEIRVARLLEGQIVARLEDNAHHMLDKLGRYFSERSLEIKLLTSSPAFLAATASPGQTARYLQEFLRWHREYVSAAFCSMDRVRVADTGGLGVGERDASESCWSELEAGNDVAVCVQRSAPGGLLELHVAVVARDGRVARGVVMLRLPLQVLAEQVREVPGLRGEVSGLHVDLVDRQGVFLYSNYQREGMLRDVSPDWGAVQERIRAGQFSGSLRYVNPAESTGEEILVFVNGRGFRDYPGSGWTLNLFFPTEALFAPVRALRLAGAVVVLLTGAALLLVIVMFVRSFSRPIEELGRAAREIGKGNLDVRVPAGSRDELGVFAEAFNQMAGDLQESHRELTAVSRELERLVEERTAELLHTNELLHAELSERTRAQEQLALRERLMRLSADVGEALTLGLPLEATLQLCAKFIVKDLDAAFFRIWTFGSEEGVLELKASAGMYTRLDGQHSRKRVGETKIGIIARENRPLLTNAVIGDDAIVDQEWARREGMRAFAGHPLVVDGKCVGVMALFSRQPLESFVILALEATAAKIATFIGRKQADEALRISEKRYRDLFDTASDGVYKTDARSVFTEMNRAGARMFGYENPEEIIGLPVINFWLSDADRKVFVRELQLKKSVSAYPIKALRRDGEPLELECSSRILEGEDGAFLGIEGMLRDVTQRVKFEAERDLLIAQLQEAAANIRSLSGLLPICAGCKKIRDDGGAWSQIETYISAHSEAEFSHGLCPECQKAYFPEVVRKS